VIAARALLRALLRSGRGLRRRAVAGHQPIALQGAIDLGEQQSGRPVARRRDRPRGDRTGEFGNAEIEARQPEVTQVRHGRSGRLRESEEAGMNGAERRGDEMLADAIGHRRRVPDQRALILEGDLRRRNAEQGDRKDEIGRLRNATHYSHLNAHAHYGSYGHAPQPNAHRAPPCNPMRKIRVSPFDNGQPIWRINLDGQLTGASSMRVSAAPRD
jgi:hypothetical protein